MSGLVSYRAIGRLGNQLFQCAAAIAYAKKHGMNWGVPANTYEVPEFHSWFPHLPVAPFSPSERYEAHAPETFGYKEIPYFRGGVTLVGFFQSLKYFENAQGEVKEAFKLPHDKRFEGHISLHVRRGDYVQNANSFPPITTEYIQLALHKLEDLGAVRGTPHIHVFSDDIEWCEKNVAQRVQSRTAMSHWLYHRGNELQDMSEMASCSHHIIANSTFSWMSAYLGHNPNKVIVSPSHENWFGPNGPKNTGDLIPDSWHQIKFR